jgi:hypothetical protein
MTFNTAIKQIDTCRIYHSGPNYFVEIDIVMDGDMPLWRAHDIAQDLQDQIEKLPDVDRCFVHIDHETDHKPVSGTCVKTSLLLTHAINLLDTGTSSSHLSIDDFPIFSLWTKEQRQTPRHDCTIESSVTFCDRFIFWFRFVTSDRIHVLVGSIELNVAGLQSNLGVLDVHGQAY